MWDSPRLSTVKDQAGYVNRDRFPFPGRERRYQPVAWARRVPATNLPFGFFLPISNLGGVRTSFPSLLGWRQAGHLTSTVVPSAHSISKWFQSSADSLTVDSDASDEIFRKQCPRRRAFPVGQHPAPELVNRTVKTSKCLMISAHRMIPRQCRCCIATSGGEMCLCRSLCHAKAGRFVFLHRASELIRVW